MKKTTVGQYLINKLKEIELEHVFGIPGDYIINFFSKLSDSEIKTVTTCTEQGAAFAADGYARINGVGALCVTYCVGGLNTVNAVAGAYAEKAPIIVISGAPGTNERDGDYLLHHSIRDVNSQYEIFKNITIASTQLTDPALAVYEIDRVVEACLKHKRPVYIELPRDMVEKECFIPPAKITHETKKDIESLKEALNEAKTLIKNAKKPVIIGGCEIRRYGLENLFLKLVEESGYPFSTTFLGKSLLDESHPQFIGTYLAKLGKEGIRKYIEESDCVIMLGALMTDTNLGTAQLDITKTIYGTIDELCIKHHYYKNTDLEDFIKGLLKEVNNYKKEITFTKEKIEKFELKKDEPLKITRFFNQLNEFLKEDSIVVCDVGDCLFGSATLKMPKNSRYYGPCYYTSMGYAVPAALGIQMKNPKRRPIIIVGDGAFQMTGIEASCYVKNGLSPIICVINNDGYTTQRYLKDGDYNNIQSWNFEQLPKLIGGGVGINVNTESELEKALKEAEANTESFTILNLHFDKMDRSEALYNLTTHLAVHVK